MRYGMWEEEMPTAEHYRGLFNNRPSVTWQEVLEAALKGKDRSSALLINHLGACAAETAGWRRVAPRRDIMQHSRPVIRTRAQK